MTMKLKADESWGLLAAVQVRIFCLLLTCLKTWTLKYIKV